MRKIKIKLPFGEETIFERKKQLLEVAQILSNKKYFSIIEEKHLPTMSYIVIYVADNFTICYEAS